MTYRNVLVCVDLRSMEATQLLRRAASLLDGDGRLCALTVIELGTFETDRDAVASMIEEEYYSRSAHLVKLCADAGCPEAEARVLVGKAPLEIAGFAAASGTDLVVLGNHTAADHQAPLGSTADATLRLLRCDALVIKPAR